MSARNHGWEVVFCLAQNSTPSFLMFKTKDEDLKQTKLIGLLSLSLNRIKEFLDKLLAYTEMALFQLDKNVSLWL